MSQSLRSIMIATSLSAVLGAAACGSDETDEPAAQFIPTVSQAEFVRQGNALCAANGEAIGSKFEAMSKPPKPAELAAAYDNMVKESYKVVGQFLAIGAPEGKERAMYDLMVEAQEVTEKVDAIGAEAFFAGETDPWQHVSEVLVKDFGLEECAHAE